MRRDERVIAILRFPQERSKPTGPSRSQPRAAPERIEKQRAIVQAAHRELLLDQHIVALGAGAHELTEEQGTRDPAGSSGLRCATDQATVRLSHCVNPLDRRDISRERSPLTLQRVGRDELRDSHSMKKIMAGLTLGAIALTGCNRHAARKDDLVSRGGRATVVPSDPTPEADVINGESKTQADLELESMQEVWNWTATVPEYQAWQPVVCHMVATGSQALVILGDMTKPVIKSSRKFGLLVQTNIATS
jgi:hypothetical protein